MNIHRPVRFNIMENGCWEVYTHKTTNGYVVISRDGKNKRLSREIYKLFNGPIPEGIFVCHECDNRGCINPDHLFLGTANDNTKDMMNKGRKPDQKLTKKDVLAIRESITLSAKELAEYYKVSKQMIYDIQQGKYWKDVGGRIRGKKAQGWHGDSNGHKKSAEARWVSVTKSNGREL